MQWLFLAHRHLFSEQNAANPWCANRMSIDKAMGKRFGFELQIEQRTSSRPSNGLVRLWYAIGSDGFAIKLAISKQPSPTHIVYIEQIVATQKIDLDTIYTILLFCLVAFRLSFTFFPVRFLFFVALHRQSHINSCTLFFSPFRYSAPDCVFTMSAPVLLHIMRD